MRSARLRQRSRSAKQTGDGQHIDVSMLEAMLSLTLLEMQEAQFEMPPRPRRPLFGPVETSDGYINIAVASERTFDGLAKTAGRTDWFEDPRFKAYANRRANWGALMDEFETGRGQSQMRSVSSTCRSKACRRRPIALCGRRWPTRRLHIGGPSAR